MLTDLYQPTMIPVLLIALAGWFILREDTVRAKRHFLLFLLGAGVFLLLAVFLTSPRYDEPYNRFAFELPTMVMPALMGLNRKMGVGASNRKLLDVCRNFRPDVIALCSADVIHADTLAEARKLLPNVAIFQYYIDPLFDASNFRNAGNKAEVVDWSFVTTAGPILSRIASHTE